jgi:hypothetical protein
MFVGYYGDDLGIGWKWTYAFIGCEEDHRAREGCHHEPRAGSFGT